MKCINLSRGKKAFVDDEDYELVCQFKWHASSSEANTYAVRNVNIYQKQGMHTLITGFSYVDHIDGNGLNNQRSNLRQSSPCLNGSNRRKTKNCSSNYKGVCWSKKAKKWQAQIRISYKRTYLGYFVNEIDAAIAYDKAALEAFGNHALLNFPRETV